MRPGDRAGGVELLRAAGVPDWAVELITDKLKVATDEEVERAARDGSMKSLLGGKANMASHVVRFIELGRWPSGGAARSGEAAARTAVLEAVPLVYATWIARMVLDGLGTIEGVKVRSTSGALRRGVEIVSSVDLIVCADDPAETARRILAACEAGRLVSRASAGPDPGPGQLGPVRESPPWREPLPAYESVSIHEGSPCSPRLNPSCHAPLRPAEPCTSRASRASERHEPGRPSPAMLVMMCVRGVRTKVYVTDSTSFPGILLRATGSTRNCRQLEAAAMERGLALDSGGLVRLEDGVAISVCDEAELYYELGIPFIPPEFREGMDEIEAARRGKLDSILQPGDVKGDIHVHTDWSDGLDSVNAVAEEAMRRGYEYVAICDHTAHHSSANGLSPERLLKAWAAIDDARRLFPSLTIMKGVEVDILPDGSLDICDSLLQAADIVLASVHDKASSSPEELTRRLARAMENPNVDVLAHPTGRKLGWKRYGVDVDVILDVARRTGVALEINCAPDRFDIDERLAQRCAAQGIMTAIGSDSHSTGEMSLLDFGVMVARRGRTPKTAALNAMTTEELLAWLSARGAPGGSEHGGVRGGDA